MRILIAPDKFKGSLGAREVAQNIAAGLRQISPKARIDIVPMADGGEGTAEVLCDALSGKWVTMRAHDPLGREITARYAYMETRQLAVMMKAGVPLLQAFEIVGRGHANPSVGKLLMDVKTDVETGSSLAQAFRKYPKHFDALFCNLVGAGEQAGRREDRQKAQQ